MTPPAPAGADRGPTDSPSTAMRGGWATWRVAGVAVAVGLLHLIVALLAFDPAPHPGGDNTGYLALARSLLDTGRYLELWAPGTPPHTQYPPGYPALLAVAIAAGLASWSRLKLLMVGISALAVGLSYLWLRARTRPAVALVAGLLVAIAPGAIARSSWLLSDVPFWAATVGALLALERRRLRIGIALALLALTLRTAGLPLLVAIALWLALRDRPRAAAGLVLGVGAAGVLWSLRARGLEAPYASQFWLVSPYRPEAGTVGVGDLGARVLDNMGEYTLDTLPTVLAGAGGWGAAVLAAGLIALACVGFGRRLSLSGPRPDVVELFAGLYVAMLLLWPATWASGRFLLPLLPLLLAYAAEGIAAVPGPVFRRALRVSGVVALFVVAIVPLLVLWRDAADCRAAVRAGGVLACMQPPQRAFIELAIRTRGTLPADAVVLSRKPRQWYWFSGMRGRTYPFSSDPDRLLEVARAEGARYVVLDELGSVSAAYLGPSVAAHAERFCAIRQVRDDGARATLAGLLPPGGSDARPEAVGPGPERGPGSSAAGPGPDAGDLPGRLRLPRCPDGVEGRYSSSSPSRP